MVTKRKLSLDNIVLEDKPSQVTDRYWIFAEAKKGKHPKSSKNNGKWLIFIPILQIDNVWAKIKVAVEEGKLGSSAKVATAKSNPNASNSNFKVICVYTYDWTKEDDVMRIREKLRSLGVTWKIPYKADEDTHSNKYANQGVKKISKYYV